MTAWHVDEEGRTWRPFSLYTCPNHPDGPVTLPAGGADELTIGQAYDHEELVDLLTLLTAARTLVPDAAGRVERMLGLCCVGHRWKVAGFQQARPSTESLASFADLLHEMRPAAAGYSILLAELAADG